MSTGYSWEGIRQVRATLLGAHHVPDRLCGGRVYLGRYIKCSTFLYLFYKVRGPLGYFTCGSCVVETCTSAGSVFECEVCTHTSPRAELLNRHFGTGSEVVLRPIRMAKYQTETKFR